MSRWTGWIRQMQYADLGRVADIWLQECIREYAFVCEHTGQTPEQFWSCRLVGMIRSTVASDGYVFETEGQIAGFMTFSPARGRIRDLFVDLPFRNQGIGSALIGVAKSLRPHILVSTYQKKVAAIRLYERQGFRITEIRPPDEETRQIKVRMEWKADPANQPIPEE
jgi:ribosomal protein S18 acetylase RimI-like enzyme